MKCPHCSIHIHENFVSEPVYGGQALGHEDGYNTSWWMGHMTCPSCRKAILRLEKNRAGHTERSLVYPKAIGRQPAAAIEVPGHLATDFNEACAVLALSPKSAAALGRRCLQHLLRDQGYNQKDLAKAIDAVLEKKVLPAALAANVDSIRNIGNFAAHPLKDSNSGEILDVEPEEAEWNLDVLEGMFDFYYVQPARDAAKIANLNAKLAAAGKPAMKA